MKIKEIKELLMKRYGAAACREGGGSIQVSKARCGSYCIPAGYAPERCAGCAAAIASRPFSAALGGSGGA